MLSIRLHNQKLENEVRMFFIYSCNYLFNELQIMFDSKNTISNIKLLVDILVIHLSILVLFRFDRISSNQ